MLVVLTEGGQLWGVECELPVTVPGDEGGGVGEEGAGGGRVAGRAEGSGPRLTSPEIKNCCFL